MTRQALVTRTTKETKVEVDLALDTTTEERIEVESGIAFFDHMLESLAKHAGLGLRLRCEGDLDVDDHHSVEDCALTLGEALDRALDNRRGIRRFGSAYAPLDEALVRAVVDLSGRPFARVDLPLKRDRIGSLSTENVSHFFESFAMRARMTLHVDLLCGFNDHHKVEAAFKAVAIALRDAVLTTSDRIASTKGVL